MNKPDYHIVTLGQRPDLMETVSRFCGPKWPAFMLEDPVAIKHFDSIYEQFLQYQQVVIEKDTDRLLAVGNCIPMNHSGDTADLSDKGFDWILTEVFENGKGNISPKLSLFALQIVIDSNLRGQSLSSEVVKAMLTTGKEHGCKALFAPVRPNKKHLYPITPIEKYIRWTDSEGLPYDPWMRVHARLGADIVKVCHASMHIAGTVAEWESWTGMQFPESGDYVVPEALVPVRIDREADTGLYVEPNVWMHHRID